jgi:hypothetical protein
LAHRIYHKNHPEHPEVSKRYREKRKNDPVFKEQRKKYYQKRKDDPVFKEKMALYHKNYMEKHKEQKKKLNAEYYKKNKQYFSKYMNKLYDKRKNDPVFRKKNKENTKIWQKKNREKVKLQLKREYARRRNKKFIEIMDNPFDETIKIHYHHINEFFVIPIPVETHLKTYTSKSKDHMEKCNGLIERYYNIDLSIFLRDGIL